MVCSSIQIGECSTISRRCLVAHRHKQHAAVNNLRLARLRLSKTVIVLACTGTVGGLYYYSSLDRQSRRKLHATADGVIRFLRYRLLQNY